MRLLHKKLLAMLLIACILTTQLVSAAPPETSKKGDDPGESAFPSIEQLFNGRNNSPYLTIYRNNYYLDMKSQSIFKGMDAMEGSISNALANILFKVQVYLTYLLVVIVYYAFEISFFELFSQIFNAIIGELRIAIYDELVLTVIVLLGLFYLIKLMSDQKTQIWMAILQTVVVMAVAFYFLTNPASFLQKVDKLSEDASKQILAGTYKAAEMGSNPDSAVMIVCNDIWMMFVHRPWQLLEFGNVALAEREEAKVLSLPVGSELRKKYVNDFAKDEVHFTSDWGVKRVGFMLLYLLPMLLMFIGIALMSLLILAYQALAIIVAMFGVFIFLLAMIPWFGWRTVQAWATKVIGYGCIKIFISFMLAIIFAFNTAIFKLSDTYGWFVVMILQLVIAAVILWKREEFFGLMTLLRTVPKGANAVNKQMSKDARIEGRISDAAKDMTLRKNTERYSKQIRTEDDSLETSEGGYRTARDTTEQRERYKGRRSSSASAGTSTETYYTEELYKDGSTSEVDSGSASLKSLMKYAEEILEKQYEASKQASEEKAQKLGKEPEYTPFVQQVMNRESMNIPRFESRELSAVINELRKVLSAGGKPEDLYKKEAYKIADQKVERPANVIELKINGERMVVNKDSGAQNAPEDMSKLYVQEFNTDYNKNYDPRFMENLIRRYGKEQVRTILDKMREQQIRKGNIKNPAGYLTESLRNSVRETVRKDKAVR